MTSVGDSTTLDQKSRICTTCREWAGSILAVPAWFACSSWAIERTSLHAFLDADKAANMASRKSVSAGTILVWRSFDLTGDLRARPRLSTFCGRERCGHCEERYVENFVPQRVWCRGPSWLPALSATEGSSLS